jgi:hypothetical protein
MAYVVRAVSPDGVTVMITVEKQTLSERSPAAVRVKAAKAILDIAMGPVGPALVDDPEDD